MIRFRRPEDMDACVALLAEVHAADRYPLLWPADPRAWLSRAWLPSERLLAAWVAADERTLLGHVALYSAVGDPAASIWSVASGLAPDHLAVVAKLFVGPRARGRGVGAALLAEATAAAHGQCLRPALEVLDHDQSAIALYERVGWQRVSSGRAPWADEGDEQALLHYYLAPDAHQV